MATNIVEMLKNDHQELVQCMDRLANAIDTKMGDCDPLFQDFKQIFTKHDKTEDKVFYPAIKRYPDLNKLILKGYQAHHMVEVGILELKFVPYNSESWGPKFLVIRDSILSHMKEEEKELFPKADELLDTTESEKLVEEANKVRS